MVGLQKGKARRVYSLPFLQFCNPAILQSREGECNMRLMRGRRIATLVFVLASLAGAALIARPYIHGLSFVIRAADVQGTPRRIADLDTTTEREREIVIPTGRGPLRARLYEPSRSRHRAALLVSGLHPAGIDEPRLVGLARQLSGSGLAIVTPDIPELSHFEITPAITDAIEQAAGWLWSDSGLAPETREKLRNIAEPLHLEVFVTPT